MARLVRGDLRPPRTLLLLLTLLTLLSLGPACRQTTRFAEPTPEAPVGLSAPDPTNADAAAAEPAPAASPGPAAADASAEIGTATRTVERSLVELLVDMRVRLLTDEACVEVDGRVNMDRGPVEVFACAPGGKTHEAVVVLDCVPSGLHAGLLALGLSPGRPFGRDADGNDVPPTGDGVRVELRWTDAAGQPRVARAEDWIWDVPESHAMQPAAWIFVGSYERRLRDGSGDTRYAADAVKSLVAIHHDPSAVLDNPWPGADDTRYHANIHAVPAVGTPLTIRFTADR